MVLTPQRLHFLVLVLLWSASLPACADRDIVYAARYYTPPGSHRTSHFHLYRINPDGTGRTQLTFGTQDDEEPLWSPDGRWILYRRASMLSLLHPAGGPPVRLLSRHDAPEDDGQVVWSPDSRTIAVFGAAALLLVDRKTHATRHLPGVTDFVWSPDGRCAYVVLGNSFSKAGSRGAVLTVKTGQQVFVPTFDATIWTAGHSAIWQGNKYLLGVAHGRKEGQIAFRVCNTAGRSVRAVSCHWSSGAFDPGADSPDLGAAGLLPGPWGASWDLWAENNNISSWQDDLYSRVETKTGRLTYFTEGQFLSFSPDGRRFCLSPHRRTVFYAPDRDETERVVWATPLQVAPLDGRLKTITPGLVWVTGADWRKRTP